MKLEDRLLPYWLEPQFMSFHFFPLSGLQYKTTGDALRSSVWEVSFTFKYFIHFSMNWVG
jgi:hypothetical protein